ncbi:MAG: hypothetical protein HRU35_06450 [Rickettsiaceae bacterium]|nr:hypothetical protein [Rickettsiaceae bacterium]
MNTETTSVAIQQCNKGFLSPFKRPSPLIWRKNNLNDCTRNSNSKITTSIANIQNANFDQINCAVWEHIISCNNLNFSEKLYYLINDLYCLRFNSWNTSSTVKNNKKVGKGVKKKQIEFSAKKIGELLGFSKRKVFNLQKSLEKKQYLHIDRSISKFGRNNVNVITPMLPDDVFCKILNTAKNKKSTPITISSNLMDMPAGEKYQALNLLKTFVPINFDLAKLVFFDNELADYTKLLYFILLICTHKSKLKNNYPTYAGTFELKKLQDECSFSRSSLDRGLKALKSKKYIRFENIRVKTEKGDSNRFDRILKYIELLAPEELLFQNLVGEKKLNSSFDAPSFMVGLERGSSVLHPQIVCSAPIYILRNPIVKNKNRSRGSIIVKNFIDDSNSNIETGNYTDSGVEDNSNSCLSFENKNSKKFTKLEKYKKPKKLADFYPISEEDNEELQRRSGRKFLKLVTNEILKDMSAKIETVEFYSKKGFMAYMALALQYELRSEALVNNINFRILANLNKDEVASHEINKFLNQLESSSDTSQKSVFKRKLVGNISDVKIYELFKNYLKLEVSNNVLKIYLSNNVELSKKDKDNILNAARYSFVVKNKKETQEEEGSTKDDWIEKIEIKKIKKSESPSNSMASIQDDELPDNVWGRMKNHLHQNGRLAAIASKWLGEEKVKIAIDDLKKTVTLKAVTGNIRDGIQTECNWLLESTAKIFGYVYLGVESIEANDSS